MLSYWEKQSFITYDIAIIGAGITGLSTAIALKEKQAHLRIIVLEKGLLPSGASTKNAGFACVGSLTEILADLDTHSQQEVFELVKLRKEGLELLRNRLGDETISYEENGAYELLFAPQAAVLNKIDEINSLLFPLFKKNVFSIVPNNFGFGEQVKYVIKSDVEGELNSGKMMHALLLKAMKMGIEIKTGYNVSHYETKGNHVLLHNETLPIEAKKIAICTNAFAQKWFSKQFVIEPGRGQVFITEKIPSLAFKGIFHFDEGYYYFRVIDQRILFGGGRNKDFNTEQTHMLALNDTIQKDLEEKLKTIILPNQDVTIAQRWSGIMAFGDKKMPIIEAIDEKVFVAIRFGGMGVAIGSKAAEILSKLMLG